MKLIPDIVEHTPEIQALRRDLHAHPELAFDEHRTADRVAEALGRWGIEVHRGLAGTGVVGKLTRGGSGRTVGLRADMDALPMTERNAFAHASTVPGRMHGCGHDGHTAMLLGAARHLAEHGRFDGTVYFVFQPAEEDGGGGQVMIDQGLFEQFPMEAIFGMHNWPGMAAGTMAVSPGPVMASCNDFRIRIKGRGAHAAMPQLAVDPLPVACQMVMAFQTIMSRNKDPRDVGVLSVTMIHAGEANNVVPSSCEIQGTVRTFRNAVTDIIERRMREISTSLCAAYGATCEFEFLRTYPPTINHAYEADFAREVMVGILGREQVPVQEPSFAAEDFGYMLQARPGAYAFIANGDGSHREAGHGMGPCTLHNASYDFNDSLLPLGSTYWVQLAERWLATPLPAGRAGADGSR